MGQLRPLPRTVDLPAMEQQVLRRWATRRVFARSLEQTRDGPLWSFLEGPPTANGKPGTHHVEARAFKDLFPRFRTMKGWYVPRRAGWDCHGLPVELEVEKELGFRGKQDIERYGVAQFNARCRESVQRHVDEFVRMTERMGYWVDFTSAYWTMNASYVESVWWSLQRIFQAGLLTRDHRVTPYCPRCGTGLSDHEVAQGYYPVSDPSVFVRFPITSGPLADRGASLLVWTTTPWTLVSNTAVAVHPDVEYVLAGHRGELLVVAAALLAQVLGPDAEVVDRFPGRHLERTGYARPFELLDIPDAHYVGVADYVTTEDGTGLVHQAPAFGAEDLAVARRYGLPVVNPVLPDGTFDPELPLVGSLFFKDADPVVVEDLRRRGLLFREEVYRHSYPHCWRCDTRLLYYALPSWFIRTTAVQDRLLAENERTDWHPATVKHGRFGDWLSNNVDWALSRARYWGTPLPIWICPEEHLTCVGSLAELGGLAGAELGGLDPHRPFVDEVTFPCPECDAPCRRVPEVIDCWYDSGSMPFAQFGYPGQGQQEFGRGYPAHFIAEGLDQTRGWFYTLLTVGTLVFDRSPYQSVLCLGIILAEDGRRMSKHLGNILDPFDLFDRHGADAVRWFMLCGGSPWADRRIGAGALDEVARKLLLTYWNTVGFLALYADAAGADPSRPGTAPWRPADRRQAPGRSERPLLDRWALSELQVTIAEVDQALEAFDPPRAGRRLQQFVDDLSNWYVRRSRRTFWLGPQTTAGASAFATLYECVHTLTRLLAPFIPFLTDYLWQVLADEGDPDSVHLSGWPVTDPGLVDDRLAEWMRLVRRLVELGRAARAEAGVKTRQPLARALVHATGWPQVPAELRALLAEELNVAAVDAVEGDATLVEYAVRPNYRALGRRFGRRTPDVAAAVGAADPAGLATALRTAGGATVQVDGASVPIGPDDVIVTEAPRAGWAVATAVGESVALDLQLTDELRRAGLLREVVRQVQEARKDGGLAVSDRIELWWQAADPVTGQAVRDGASLLAAEVLASTVHDSAPAAPLAPHHHGQLGLTFWFRPVG